eukprot:3146580-Pyramimonas_sp.AAC.2
MICATRRSMYSKAITWLKNDCGGTERRSVVPGTCANSGHTHEDSSATDPARRVGRRGVCIYCSMS